MADADVPEPPGVDLRVTASADGGISEQLIVRTRAAADGSWLRTFAQRYSSPGLRLASDAAGNVQAIGAHGVVAFNSSPPLIVSEAQIGEVFDKVARVIRAVD